MINNDYPLNTLNQLRPLLIGFRKANGLTQKDLSERLGVTQQTYSRLEANPASASIERLFWEVEPGPHDYEYGPQYPYFPDQR